MGKIIASVHKMKHSPVQFFHAYGKNKFSRREKDLTYANFQDLHGK